MRKSITKESTWRSNQWAKLLADRGSEELAAADTALTRCGWEEKDKSRRKKNVSTMFD